MIPQRTMTAPSALAARNLDFDFRAVQEDNIQIRMLLNTMGALADDGSPLATVIKQAMDLIDQAKQRIDAKADAPSRSQSRGQNAPQRSNRLVAGGSRYQPRPGCDMRPQLETHRRNCDAWETINVNRA